MAQDVPGSGEFAHAGVTARRGPVAPHHRYGIVVARFNAGITERLYAGAVQALLDAGVSANHIHSVQVPGAVEIPIAVRALIEKEGCEAVVALGCVIRGETAHFDYVCRTANDGCLRVSLDHHVPVGFGVLTVENVEQAEARSAVPGSSGHNVGADAANAVLEVVGLVSHLGD